MQLSPTITPHGEKIIYWEVSRSDASFFVHQKIPYLKLLKESLLKSAYHKDALDANLLLTKMSIALVTQVELLLQKKLVNTSSWNFTLKLNEAQAIAFVMILQKIPVMQNENYTLNMINSWIYCLHKQV